MSVKRNFGTNGLSELQFSSALDNLSDGLAICFPVSSSDGKTTGFTFRYVNNQLSRILGIRKEELLGGELSETVPCFMQEEHFRLCLQALDSPEPQFIKDISLSELLRSEKSRLYYDIKISGHKDGITLVFNDISVRKNTEEALWHERELFEGIFNSIPVMITIFDPNLMSFRFNNEIKKVLGWTEEDTLEGNFMEKVYPDANYRTMVSLYMQSLEPGWREFQVTAKDGRRIESSWSNIRLKDNTSIGIGIDLSRIKMAENLLRESRRELLEAQRIAHLGSFTYNAATGILDWTDEVFRIFERDEKKGHPTAKEVMDYVYPDDRGYVLDCLKRAEETRGTLYMEYRILTDKNNIKYLRYIGNPVFNEEGRLIKRFGTVLDITKSKVTELELKRTMEELARSNKELEQFAYVASHDLQEPLRMVTSFAGLLSRQYSDKLDDRAQQFIEFMVEGTKRMQSLISDLLQYSRITTKVQPFRPTDLNAIMGNIISDLRISIEENKARIICSRLPEVYADPLQMRQLLYNLITNAIKFRAEKNPEITVQARKDHTEWLFSVSDNGIGISPEFHERIFIIFQRLHERDKYAGTGIGLALCKKIVDNHGGRIWVESEEGRGSTFYFTIKQ